mgnify:FL=1
MAVSSSDFFERQEKARRATRRLVFWFAFGLAGTAAAVYFLVIFALKASGCYDASSASLWDPKTAACVFAGTLMVVGGASLVKSREFGSSAGADVARQLGGREVSPDASRPDERRLINVVQEMSLASGVPVPRIFILENERGINAFAAGTSADRAAVAVSRGALDKLSRDELQAVVGHEFSHILNGDMQLNIRLVGWIFGLIVISLLGQILLRAGAFSPRTRSRDGKNAAALVLLIGVGLLAIGFISQIFAQIIQAAISRHRERLADASATQFTRNPKALANALSRIGGDAAGSRISSPRAGEFAHLFFASGVNALFATHPPLEERIRALDPSWDGEFLPPLSAPERAENAEANLSGLRNVSETNSVPPFLAEMTRNADDAKTLICLLMMTDSPERNVEQAKILLEREKSAVFKKMEHLWERMRNFPREKRIAAVLVAAPALRELSARDRREFCETLDLLAQTDGNVSIFEFCILAAVRGLLLSESQRKLSPSDVRSEAELVLNFFLRGNKTPRSRWAQDLSAALAKQTMFPGSLRVLDDAALNFPALEAAFRKLRASPIRIREQLLFTARDVIAADGEITPEENDVLSAFAVALACPAPQGSV